MGRQIDSNRRWSEDEKEYLRSRGRGYLIAENERRFGTDENPVSSPDQGEDGQESAFYDDSVRQNAIYDVGGAPLPDTVLDYNTGRVFDRENGVLAEFTGPGHTPGAHDLRGRREPEGFNSYDVDEQGNPVDDNVDDDIVEHVTNAENKPALVKELTKLNKKGFGDEPKGDDSREELENKVAIALQDERNSEKANA
jgi:hypothetical protein